MTTPPDTGATEAMSDEVEKPPGLTVGELRAKLAGLPDGMFVLVRTVEECGDFSGGIFAAEVEDNCAGESFVLS